MCRSPQTSLDARPHVPACVRPALGSNCGSSSVTPIPPASTRRRARTAARAREGVVVGQAICSSRLRAAGARASRRCEENERWGQLARQGHRARPGPSTSVLTWRVEPRRRGRGRFRCARAWEAAVGASTPCTLALLDGASPRPHLLPADADARSAIGALRVAGGGRLVSSQASRAARSPTRTATAGLRRGGSAARYQHHVR